MEIQQPVRRLLHLRDRDLFEIPIPDDNPVELIDGDVYVYDIGNKIWIWIGKDSSVDEGAAAAFLTNKIDHERGGVPDVRTINEGAEPTEFKESLNFVVIDGDTPGFLKSAVLDKVEYKLFRVYIEEDTSRFDEALTEEVELSRDSLTPDDVFVLDANEKIFCFVGKECQLEERIRGQRLMQKIDAERNYLPLQYTIYEGEGGKSEKAFYELLDKLSALEDKTTTSVEDFRELEYKPEEAKSAEEAKIISDHEFATASVYDKGYKSSEQLKEELEYEEAKGSDASVMGKVMSESDSVQEE